jgi:peptidoglycan DL-endopeptidase CwlO
MTGVAAVQARIAELQSQIQAFAPRPVVRATGSGAASATDFSALMQAALADETGTVTAGSSGGATGQGLVDAAKKYLGVPYVWGGTNPAKGLDCSGLVQRAMKDIGVDVPRTVAQQRHVGTPVPSLAQAKPGDLIVLGGDRHIGIYVGDGKMLHAPKTGDVVKIAKVYETPTSIRRVLPEAGAAASFSNVLGTAAARPQALRASAALPGISSAVAGYNQLFTAATAKYGLPQGLLAAVAQTESGGNASAISPAGAIGLMQIMPGTARGLGVDPRDPAQAVDGAARLLSSHLRDFGSLDLALAAYNAGPGAVRKYDGIPPYSETQNYVRKVTALLGQGAR